MFRQVTSTAQKVKPLLFSPSELKQVLSTYSQGVLIRNWKDYAIIPYDEQSTFAVVDNGVVAFSITKIKNGKGGEPSFLVHKRHLPVLKSQSFLEALTCFARGGEKLKTVGV